MLFLTAEWPRHSYALDGSRLRPKRNCSGYLAAPAGPVISERTATRRPEKYPLFISISLARYRNEWARRLHKITWQELKSSTGISRNNHPTKGCWIPSGTRLSGPADLIKEIVKNDY